MLIDTHTHIADPEFDIDREVVIERALSANVQKMILIGTDLASSKRAVALAERYPFLFATVGLHPHESHVMNETLLISLKSLCGHPKVVGCGEMGLDYHYHHATQEDQRHAFVAQIRLAKEKRLPLIVHSREAWEEMFDYLEQEQVQTHAKEVGAVFHCFTGDKKVAERAIDLGFYISFSGIVTFPKAADLQEIASTMPIEKMLIETDAPYLAPQGFRGKRNEPAYVRVVAEKIAALRSCSLEEIAVQTSQNAIRLFGLSGC